MDTYYFMQEANKLAKNGMTNGDGGPFGAVIVKNGEIIGRGWNKVLRTNDPSAHAEIVAIRDACSNEGSYWLENCHIYVNCEPCPMCLAAIYWARIPKLTFGATRKDAADIGFDDNFIYREVCLPLTERTVICTQSNRKEALQTMQLWTNFTDKKDY